MSRKPKNRLLKKIVKQATKLIAWLPRRKKETASLGSNQFSHPSRTPSKANSNAMSSKSPLTKAETPSQPDRPNTNNMGIKAPQFDGNQNLPPHVQEQISAVVARAVEKIDPELREITQILKVNGIHGHIEFGMMPTEGIPSLFMPGFPFPFAVPHPPQPATPPANDLVRGIKKILDTSFGDCAEQILGMMFDPHYSVALDIARILEAARKRDQESVARELETIATKLRKQL